ncbi:hypothetical protein CBS101457_002224 [Exobasidium rhododendri]|nr:hypothetical protein CBS101457_002224 [Exobasidium rhododendri]
MGDISASSFDRSFQHATATSSNPLAVYNLTSPSTSSAPPLGGSKDARDPRDAPGRSAAFECPSLNDVLQSHGGVRPLVAPRFRLQIRQQPERGLAVGTDDSAYKRARAIPIDPPPICELVPEQSSDLKYISVPEVSVLARLVHCDAPFEEEASNRQFRDPLISGIQESGFIAPVMAHVELGVRRAGNYRIRFDLVDRCGLRFQCLASVFTQPFTVTSDAKAFTGLQASSELLHALVKRGLKLRINKGPQNEKKAVKKRKRLIGDSEATSINALKVAVNSPSHSRHPRSASPARPPPSSLQSRSPLWSGHFPPESRPHSGSQAGSQAGSHSRPHSRPHSATHSQTYSQHSPLYDTLPSAASCIPALVVQSPAPAPVSPHHHNNTSWQARPMLSPPFLPQLYNARRQEPPSSSSSFSTASHSSSGGSELTSQSSLTSRSASTLRGGSKAVDRPGSRSGFGTSSHSLPPLYQHLNKIDYSIKSDASMSGTNRGDGASYRIRTQPPQQLEQHKPRSGNHFRPLLPPLNSLHSTPPSPTFYSPSRRNVSPHRQTHSPSFFFQQRE